MPVAEIKGFGDPLSSSSPSIWEDQNYYALVDLGFGLVLGWISKHLSIEKDYYFLLSDRLNYT